MKIVTALTLIFITHVSLSQNEVNIWYFGNHAGVDFNSGTPVAISGGQTYNVYGYSEGTSSLSDEFGNLLMYTNGEVLWNKNHQVMLNGDSLFGNASSTQSSIIIPQPNSKNLYYVFTIDDVWESTTNYGFRYSVVDMCEDNKNGIIISTQKNVLLLDNVYEKLGAVKHSNGIDYWIVTHKLNSNQYYSYLLDQSGISDTVISSIGSTSTFGQGQMKFSPNGQQMAVVHNQHWGGNVEFELFDFNNSTGIFSNPTILSSQSYNVYGIEFSPDNSILYAVYSGFPSGVTTLKIVQFDLSSGNQTTINNSQLTVYQNNTISLRGLQLGPDNKIYMVAIPNDNYLLSINDPDILGAGCNIQDNAVFLNGNTGDKSLPTFVAGFSYGNINFNSCLVSIDENNYDHFFFYPNPLTTSNLMLKTNHHINQGRIVIYNTLGKIILDKDNLSGKNFTFDLNKLSDNVLFVELFEDRTCITREIIIRTN